MGRNKQFKIAQTKVMNNIIEPPIDTKGKWNEIFGNSNPIVLELACGKGHYTLGMARKNPAVNYIGIDIKGARLWKGGCIAQEENLTQVRFMRILIDHIDQYFASGEVDEIWITFPDPQPRKEKKRLTHPLFLNKYQRIIKPGGKIHLKTDNTAFFEFTIGVMCGLGLSTEIVSRNLYHSDLYQDEILQIKTHYEEKFTAEGEQIKYCRFSLPTL